MKEKLWIAAAGVLLLAGCKSEVMDERHYTPAPQAPGNFVPMTVPAAMPNVPAAPAVRQYYPPMTGVFSSGGVDSVAGAAGKTAGEYVVKKGDTLGKIAAMHRLSLSSLMTANHLTNADAKRLAVGKKLVIPAGGKAVAAIGKSSGKKASSAPVKTPELNKDGFYEIQSGDTIGKIAARFHVRSAEILKVNNLTDADARRLQIGMKIAIPGKSAALPAKTGATAETATAATSVAPVEPTSAIAVPVTVVDNPEAGEDEDLATDSTIMVEVEEDVPLADFAAKHGTTPEELRKYNKDCPDSLRRGDPILVPNKK